METKDNNTLKEKILKGLALSYKKMIEHKRRNQQKIVILKNDKIITFVP